MYNISKFSTGTHSLSAGILGNATPENDKTDKIDQIARENLDKGLSSHPKSLVNSLHDLDISSDKITAGQGEYVVYHKYPNGERKPVSAEIFEKAYVTLLHYSPAILMNSGSENAIEKSINRYELIKTKLKEIDTSLEVVFVPRTLYELIFIKKCIKEDLKHKGICSNLSPSEHNVSIETFRNNQQRYEEFLALLKILNKERKCWHLCYFTDSGDNENAELKKVAYRLNKAVVKALSPTSEGFTHQEFLAHAENEIEFLKTHYKNCNEIIEKKKRGENVKEISSSVTPGPTTNFGFESTRNNITPMGIRNETDAQIIRNAVALDCSQLAQKSFILYRGTDFKKDTVYCWTDKSIPYSLSYGTSLFAGCLFDGKASAFYNLRNGENAYAVSVGFDQYLQSPFYIPPSTSLSQLYGDGEIFHGRTKACKDFDLNRLEGMNTGVNGRKRDHLKSNLTMDELTSRFQEFKKNAYLLK